MRLEAFASWVLVALLSACHAEPQPPAASATQASVEPPTKKTAATQATTLPAPGAALETEFTPDSRRLVILTTEHTIEIFNAEDGERISTIKAPEFVFDVDVSPDGAWIVAAGERGAYVWSAKDFALRQTIRESSETLAFAAEGAYLTTANGGAFYVWELATGKSIARVNDQNEARLNWLHMGRSYLREARAVQFWNIHRGGVALLPWLSTSPSPQGGALIMTDSSTEKTLVTRDLSFESIATLQGRWMLMDRRVLSSQEARHSLLRLNACQTECAEPQDGFSSPRRMVLSSVGARWTRRLSRHLKATRTLLR